MLELPSWDVYIRGLMVAPADDTSTGGRARRLERKYRLDGHKQGNRVLMLGRLRELALYRAEVLRNHGFDVLAPESEEEAVTLIQRGNFDIAILSYTLPDTTVKQFVDLIRQCCPDARILAIAQTMQYDRKIEPDSVVIGENGPDELVTALRKLSNGH